MNAPTRWSDDTEAQRRLGLDFSAESDSLAPHDLPTLKMLTLGAATSAAPLLSTSGIRLAVQVGAVGLVLGGVLGAATHALLTNTKPALPVAAPVATPQPTAQTGETDARTAPNDNAGTPATAAPMATPEPEAHKTAVPAKAKDSGTLAEELRWLDRAEVALTRGDATIALTEAEAYLARFKNGQLRSEAQLVQLEALLRNQRPAEALALTLAWQKLPRFGDHQQTLQRAEVRALVALSRCDEATQRAANDAVAQAAVAGCRPPR